VITEALHYMNDYVVPSNLVSLSIFEDDHPNPKNFYHAVVYHKGEGQTPVTHPADI
jgi:hypothetical protein